MILPLTIKATAVLLAVATGALALRRSSAATRHLTRVAGLVGILLLPAMVAGGPRWELPLLAQQPAAAAAAGHAAKTADRATSLSDPSQEAVATPRSTSDSADAAWLAAASPGPDAPALPPSEDLASPIAWLSGLPQTGGSWLAVVWGAGVLLLLTRLGAGWLAMTRTAFDATPLGDGASRRLVEGCCRRLGIDRTPRVLVSPSIRVPLLWGFVSPTLLLPEAARAWPQGRLRIVLLHELAHLRRRDGLTLLLGRLATATWWFHPLAWIVDRGARRDCERACDDLVLATGEKPSEYAAHLLAVARELPRTPAPTAALAFAGTTQLESRVRSILRPQSRRGVGRLTACAVFTLMLAWLLPVSSARLVAREADPNVAPMRLAAATANQDVPPAADEPILAVRTASAPEYLLAHDGRYHEGEEIFQRAYEHHREGEYADAAPLFLEAAEAGYRVSTSLYNAACGHAQLGQAGRAIGYIEQAIEEGFDDGKLLLTDTDLDPIRGDTDFRAMLDRVRADRDTAIGRRAADRYEEVHAAFGELVEEGSTDGREWYRVGSRLLQLREFDTAIEALGRAAELLEQNQNALYNLACTYALMDNKSAALDHLERAVLAGFSSEERFDEDTDLDNVRGSKRFEQIRDLNETLSLDRFGNSKWNFWGDDQYSPRRWEPAVREFSEFTRANPDVGRGWFNLGWALHFSRRHAEARSAFERQRSTGYRPGNASYNIACTYAMENNVDAALEALEQAVELGAVSAGHMLSDDDLESLRDDPRFVDLVEDAAERDGDEDEDLREKLDRWMRERKMSEKARSY